MILKSHFRWLSLCAASVVGLLCSDRASGELAFPDARKAVNITSLDKVVRVDFPFKNTGAKAVTITGTRSDCGCTTAKSDKTTVPPGASGTVSAEFTVGERMGPQKSVIMVSTDDPGQPFVPLELATEIPKAITLSANVLLWEVTENGAAKSLTVTADPAASVASISARSENPNLEIRVDRVNALEFRINVAPIANKRNLNATLIVEAVLAGDVRKRATAFVRVR